MAYENPGAGALNYQPCRYGDSRLTFRGPKAKLDGRYIAFLGGTETYGKFVEVPFPALVERVTHVPSLNLGCVNAGVDVFMNDGTVLDLAKRASATVIQITGAQNLSNRFYAVHPRRNDRFLRASAVLRTIYRDIDFTEFNFTRHLLTRLQDASPENFAMVRQELRDAWLARMRGLLARVHGPVVLLWLSEHAPDDAEASDAIGADPLFVTRDMLDALRPFVKDIVEIVAEPDEIARGYEQMVYPPLDAPSARELLGPEVHARAATALGASIAARI